MADYTVYTTAPCPGGSLIDPDLLGTGTSSSSTFLRGDGTWATPGGSGNPLDAWPVGSVYIAVDSTSPATRFGGGTWAAIGAGRVLVGLDSGDTDFDVAEETGGAKTVASAGTNSGGAVDAHSGTAVAAHADHTHTYTQVPNHVHPLATGTGSTGSFSQVLGTVDTSSGGTGGSPTQTALGTLSGNPNGGVATGTTAGASASLTHSVTQPANHTFTQPTFAGSATSVVQPYLVVYMWKRTA